MPTSLPHHPVAGTLVATPPRWRLRVQRTFPQMPNEIWAAITEPERVGRWAPFRPDRNIATEGPVRLQPVDGSDETHDSNVLETTPHESLTYFWGADQLRFTITDDDDGTTLTLVQTFDDHNSAASMAAGWHLCLGALELLLQGEDVPSVVGENAKAFGWDELEAAYSALFESQTDRSIPDDQTEEERRRHGQAYTQWRHRSDAPPIGAVMIHSLVAQHIHAIRALCDEFGVVRLEMFDLPPGDEPALLVTFTKGDDGRSLRRLAEMEERLAGVLGQDVTLLAVAALRNEWLRDAAWPTRSTVYEAPAS